MGVRTAKRLLGGDTMKASISTTTLHAATNRATTRTDLIMFPSHKISCDYIMLWASQVNGGM
eukprot:scaffold57235_cov58-Attheya_sp.AAC.1